MEPINLDITTPMEERADLRFNTPAPELDDHRRRRGNTRSSHHQHLRAEPLRAELPTLAVHEPTPRSSTIDTQNLLHVDDTLRNLPEINASNSIARDFEHAVIDTEGEEDELVSPLARASSRRRDTQRGRRPRAFRQQDRSRDTSSSSSSRSTSPANSLEAFAEPRRRQRAGTVGSMADSVDWQRARAGSYTERRPTLSNISIPEIKSRTHTRRGDEDSIRFDPDEEPGKTYKIDFEELEEFVALCNKGLIDVESMSSQDTKVFLDQTQRPETRKAAIPNAALNAETFYEQPLDTAESSIIDEKTDEKAAKVKTKAAKFSTDRFTFFSSDLQQARCTNTLGGFVKDGSKFQDLFDVGPEGGVWWLDVLNPTKAELDVLASAFRIHRLTKEDIETQEPREKVELFSQYYFVCFRSFNMHRHDEDFLDPIHLYIIVTSDGVLSFSYTSNPHAKNVRKRISKLGDFVSLGPDYICYALIDDIVDSFAPIIRNAETESENIEDQVFIARDEDFSALLKQIGDARKQVLNMMRLLGGKADVIKGFAKRCNEQFEMTPRGDIGLYLGDIQDHVVTMMSNLGHVEKMLSRSHANYLAQLNVDHLLKGNSTNKALAKITVFATILVPLNLITGLFGMNVHVPGEGVDGYAWFGSILGVIALFITISLVTARRLKFI